jgi:hypothetical protein
VFAKVGHEHVDDLEIKQGVHASKEAVCLEDLVFVSHILQNPELHAGVVHHFPSCPWNMHVTRPLDRLNTRGDLVVACKSGAEEDVQKLRVAYFFCLAVYVPLLVMSWLSMFTRSLSIVPYR